MVTNVKLCYTSQGMIENVVDKVSDVRGQSLLFLRGVASNTFPQKRGDVRRFDG